MKIESYRRLDSCVNCKHCLHKSNYEYTECYCVKDLKEIPIEKCYISPNETSPHFDKFIGLNPIIDARYFLKIIIFISKL